MLKTVEKQPLENLWDDGAATGMSEPEKLLYRSYLLGSDKRITNFGGGNTSAKVMETDPLDPDDNSVEELLQQNALTALRVTGSNLALASCSCGA